MMEPDLIDFNNNRVKYDSDWYERDKFVLMQGLDTQDGSGTQIYECDVCIVRDGTLDEEDGFFIIEFDKETLQYVLMGNGLCVTFDNLYAHYIEVIGNIYENPELVAENDLEEEVEK